MRWIDRGPEPDGVAGYALKFTPGWVNRIAGRPTDSHWREFRDALGSRSNGNCWYCERRCAPASERTNSRAATLDHFRPLNLFPELAYEWNNWIFSCQRCNDGNKGNKWPTAGYVDPAAATESECPERYFDYDMDSGHIIPRKDLPKNSDARKKAKATIDDLGLNKLDVWFYRLDYTRNIVADLRLLPIAERQAFADTYLELPIEYVGITGMVLSQLRQRGEI